MENSTANDLRSLYAQRKATNTALKTVRTNVIRQVAIDLANSHEELSSTEIASRYGLPVNALHTLLLNHFGPGCHQVHTGTFVKITAVEKFIPIYYRQTNADGIPFGPVITCHKKIWVYSGKYR